MAQSHQPPEPILLAVLTGFLGSGKTTLLNHVLSDDAFSNTVVIINEFGDVGLDHLLVESSTEQMIEMSSGCLCCSIRGDLCDTLEKLLRDRDNGRLKKFDRVIIETTGLADPAPILQTLIQHPYFLKRFQLNSVIATIDAQHGMNTLDQHTEAKKQAAMADVLVITKTDLVLADDEQLKALENRLLSLNPTAKNLNAQSHNVLDAFLSENTYEPDRKDPDVLAWLAQDYETHHHTHDHVQDHHHHHDVNRHGDTIRSFSFVYDEAILVRQFDFFLELVRSNFGSQLLRFKGLVKIKEHEDKPVISHGVQHVFYPPRILDKWPCEERVTRIVCITDGVEKSKIESLFHAFAGEIETDFQTHAYNRENPLSLKPGDGLFKGESR